MHCLQARRCDQGVSRSALSMSVFIALLRAVNVGGTGKLPMADLVRMAEALGFRDPETYIASGNLIFEWEGSEEAVTAELQRALAAYAGREVGVMVRTSVEMAAILEANPFADDPPERTAVVFLAAAPPDNAVAGVVGRTNEQIRPGRREFYIFYPDGMGRSRMRMPAAAGGTARNINTVRKLVELSARR